MFDVKERFPLGEHGDGVHIFHHESHIQLSRSLTYEVRGRFTLSTLTFCELAGMDEETTVWWLLKYGDKLPMHLHQL
jgi:hypothetical protein